MGHWHVETQAFAGCPQAQPQGSREQGPTCEITGTPIHQFDAGYPGILKRTDRPSLIAPTLELHAPYPFVSPTLVMCPAILLHHTTLPCQPVS